MNGGPSMNSGRPGGGGPPPNDQPNGEGPVDELKEEYRLPGAGGTSGTGNIYIRENVQSPYASHDTHQK